MPANGQRLSKEARLKQVDDCLASGLSVKQWCDENGVSVKTLYYWMGRSECRDKHDPQWIDLSKGSEPEIGLATADKAYVTVRVGKFSIECTGAVDLDRLAPILKAAVSLC